MGDWKDKVIVALAIAGILAGATGLMKLSVIESAFADTQKRVDKNEERSVKNDSDKKVLEEKLKAVEAKLEDLKADTKAILWEVRRAQREGSK